MIDRSQLLEYFCCRLRIHPNKFCLSVTSYSVRMIFWLSHGKQVLKSSNLQSLYSKITAWSLKLSHIILVAFITYFFFHAIKRPPFGLPLVRFLSDLTAGLKKKSNESLILFDILNLLFFNWKCSWPQMMSEKVNNFCKQDCLCTGKPVLLQDTIVTGLEA